MNRNHKRQGSAYMMVIMVFIFVSVFSAMMLSALSQSIYESHAYSLQMQCYYLNNQAAKATVAALLADDNQLLRDATYPKLDTLEHKDAALSKDLGISEIRLTRENHDYYGESKSWIVADITTTIKDPRATRAGQDFTYVGSVMVLEENPLIQLFNLNPNDF